MTVNNFDGFPFKLVEYFCESSMYKSIPLRALWSNVLFSWECAIASTGGRFVRPQSDLWWGQHAKQTWDFPRIPSLCYLSKYRIMRRERQNLAFSWRSHDPMNRIYKSVNRQSYEDSLSICAVGSPLTHQLALREQ